MARLIPRAVQWRYLASGAHALRHGYALPALPAMSTLGRVIRASPGKHTRLLFPICPFVALSRHSAPQPRLHDATKAMLAAKLVGPRPGRTGLRFLVHEINPGDLPHDGVASICSDRGAGRSGQWPDS